METRNAYGYVRVSTDKQEELSPESQRKLLQEYADKNNICLLDVFFEIGVSGRNAEKRPEFQKMIGLAKANDHPVDAILVWKFSRFARNQEESIVYKSLLKREADIDVISISEPLIDGPFGSLIERIIEWMDEYYSIRLSGEVLRGMTENALRGGYQSTPCLGYDAVGNGKPYVINEEEYKTCQYIFDQFDIYKKNATRIARQLNDADMRTKRGGMFDVRSVNRILKNRFYIGYVSWNGHEFKGKHETRLSEERFNERMERIKSTYTPRGRRSISACRHWLSGIVRCPTCGASLVCNNVKGKGKASFFSCWRYAKGMHSGSASITEKKLIRLVYKNFENILGGQEFELNYMSNFPTGQVDLENLQKKLSRIGIREKRIKEAYEAGVDTLEEYKANKERLLEERRDIETQIEAMNEKEPPKKEDYLEKIKTVYDAITDPEVDYETKGTMMRSVLEDIVYDKENQQLIFHFYYS